MLSVQDVRVKQVTILSEQSVLCSVSTPIKYRLGLLETLTKIVPNKKHHVQLVLTTFANGKPNEEKRKRNLN